MAYIKGRKAFQQETFPVMLECPYEDEHKIKDWCAGYDDAFHENMKANEGWVFGEQA
jgi:hypothetical protein